MRAGTAHCFGKVMRSFAFPLAHYLALHAMAVNTKKKPGDYQVRLAKWVRENGDLAAKAGNTTSFGGISFRLI